MMRSFFIAFLLLGSFYGCASAPVTYTAPMAATTVPAGIPGIYHRVEKGQTLWRISKIYDIELDELTRINHISDKTPIEIGQQIFIPEKQRSTGKKITKSRNYPNSKDDFIWPVKGHVVSTYNESYSNMTNKGLYIRTTSARDILSTRSGKVVFASPSFKGYGKIIILEHSDGFFSVYTGPLELLARPGDLVNQGETIAHISGSKELHFEIRKGHLPQNPNFYLP